MPVYRGPGGAGDATNDATISAVQTYATQAATSATQAATSATNAATSASGASTSATNAATSATTAAGSATTAAGHASSASTYATNSSLSAADSAASALEAEGYASEAFDYKVAASLSESNAADSADAAQASQAAAETAALSASTIVTDPEFIAVVDSLDEINTVANNSTNINKVAAIDTNVTTVAGVSTNVTTVAGISTAVTTVATNNANVSTVAGISGNVTTVAGISANVTTVAGISSNVTTVATNNANVTTVATNIADINAVADALAAPLSAAIGVSYSNTSSKLVATNVQTAIDETNTAARALADARLREDFRKEKSTSIAPSLLFDFAGDKIIDPNLTYTRASTGTYTDVLGVVQTATSGTARFTHDPITGESMGLLIEPQATNLVLASEKFDQQNLFTQSGVFDNAAWTKSAQASVTSGQSDPFGGTTAYKLFESSATSGSHAVTQAPTITTGVGAYTYSFYAKAAERTWCALYWLSSTSAVAYFDLQNGVVGTVSGTQSPTNATITSVGSGWYRCSVRIIPSTVSGAWAITPATGDNSALSYAGTTNSGVLIYGAQLERSYGTTPSTYYATTSTNFQPWVTLQTTLTPSSGTAPDGTNSAYKVVAVSGQTLNNAANYLRCAAFGPLTAGDKYTVSVYAKASGYNTLSLRYANSAVIGSGFGAEAKFNLSTGTVVSLLGGYNATIQSVGNGWYRCSVSGSAVTSNVHYAGIWNADTTATTADGTSGILLWGFQVESGESSTTYIKTTSAQATRNADVVSIANTNWLNQSEGTIFADRKLRGTKDQQTLFSLDNGTIDIEAKTVLGTNSVNLFTRTEQFDAPVWTRNLITIVPNALIAPDGTLTADKIISNTTVAQHSVSQIVSYTSGVTYTLSVYAKKGEYEVAKLGFPTAAMGASTYATFDLNTGSVTSSNNSPTTSAVSVGNGWWKISITKVATATISTTAIIYNQNNSVNHNYAGDDVSGAYIWGAQLEANSSVSTYEPNPKYVTSFEVGSTGLIQTANYASIDLPNLYQKSAFAYKTDDASYYRGGSSVGADTSVTVPSSLNRLVIGGSAISSGREINGTIKKLAYYPRKLTNAELQSLST